MNADSAASMSPTTRRMLGFVIARQPLAELLEHRRPVDQQIEDDHRRDQQDGDEVNEGRALIPSALRQRAGDSRPVRRESRAIALLNDALDLLEAITEDLAPPRLELRAHGFDVGRQRGDDLLRLPD